MLLYHGSDHIIEKPTLALSNPANDYGPGFYCTRELPLAKEWACKRKTDGYANAYELDEANLSILDLQAPEYSVLNWIALLLENRHFSLRNPVAEDARDYLLANFSLPVERYDVIVGYRADDSYFSYAQDFVENGLTVQQLNQALHLGNLGQQTVLVSLRAFESIRFLEAEPAAVAEYYPKFLKRDIAAREEYRNEIRRAPVTEDGLFVADIIREKVKNDDPRLR